MAGYLTAREGCKKGTLGSAEGGETIGLKLLSEAKNKDAVFKKL